MRIVYWGLHVLVVSLKGSIYYSNNNAWYKYTDITKRQTFNGWQKITNTQKTEEENGNV